MNTTQPVALITGASSGFGELIGATLSRRGYSVYGTSRRELPDQHGIHMRVLDVTSDASVHACISGILAEAGRVDLLINNAGVTVSGTAEETPLHEAEALFQTNFFGAARVTNAVLLGMRERKDGRLIFISSLAGLLGTPGQAYYAASKHALEGYAETLAAEVAQFDIDVSLVEPGFFRTTIHDKASLNQDNLVADYNGTREALHRYFNDHVQGGDDPQKVADLVAKIAVAHKPKLRYRVGRDAVWTPRLKALMPEEMFFSGMRRQFGI